MTGFRISFFNMTIQADGEDVKFSVFQENVKIPQQMTEGIMTVKTLFLGKCQNDIAN